MSFDAAIREIRHALSDPATVLSALGFHMGRGVLRQTGGFLVRCPVHAEKTPSCSIQRKSKGIMWKCHGCDASGDVFSFVAAVRGLSTRTEFRQVLLEAASTAGLYTLVAELEWGSDSYIPIAEPVRRQVEVSEPERTYPPPEEVDALWGSCVPATASSDGGSWLASRGLDVERLFCRGLVKEVTRNVTLPAWASFRGMPWMVSGHLLLVPMFDAGGTLRSLRASRVWDNDTPKRLPPGGYRASGLVMAEELSLAMLRGTWKPTRVVIAEGEPDFWSLATRTGVAAHAYLGIVSGSWTDELAAKIPTGAEVFIRTDNDRAGDKYAKTIIDSLQDRCVLRRKKAR